MMGCPHCHRYWELYSESPGVLGQEILKLLVVEEGLVVEFEGQSALEDGQVVGRPT